MYEEHSRLLPCRTHTIMNISRLYLDRLYIAPTVHRGFLRQFSCSPSRLHCVSWCLRSFHLLEYSVTLFSLQLSRTGCRHNVQFHFWGGAGQSVGRWVSSEGCNAGKFRTDKIRFFIQEARDFSVNTPTNKHSFGKFKMVLSTQTAPLCTTAGQRRDQMYGIVTMEHFPHCCLMAFSLNLPATIALSQPHFRKMLYDIQHMCWEVLTRALGNKRMCVKVSQSGFLIPAFTECSFLSSWRMLTPRSTAWHVCGSWKMNATVSSVCEQVCSRFNRSGTLKEACFEVTWIQSH